MPFLNRTIFFHKSTILNIIKFILLFSFCFCEDTDDLQREGIKSEVIYKYNFREEFGEYNEILSGKVKIKYDKNGNRIRYSSNDLKNKYKSFKKSASKKIQ